MKLFPFCRFTQYPARSAKVGYWGLLYWALGTVSAQCFFSLHCIFVPLHCRQLGILHLFAWGAWQSKMTTAKASVSHARTVESTPRLCHEALWPPHWQVWVGALWMTLSGGWVRDPDLHSTAGIIQCLSGRTLSAILCLMILWLSPIGSLVPVSWHCALFYNLLPR